VVHYSPSAEPWSLPQRANFASAGSSLSGLSHRGSGEGKGRSADCFIAVKR